jgi:hypothetical protein
LGPTVAEEFRIAVMTRRPATIREVVENPLPHPRDPDQPALRALRHSSSPRWGWSAGCEMQSLQQDHPQTMNTAAC